MAALVAAIHVFPEPQRRKDVDPRDKPGDDGEVVWRKC
jgi:hypothetical protein